MPNRLECEAVLDNCDYKNPTKVEELKTELGENYSVVWSDGYSEWPGHHEYITLYKTMDVHYILAECGGCSCGASGSYFPVTLEEAKGLIGEVYKQSYLDWLAENPNG